MAMTDTGITSTDLDSASDKNRVPIAIISNSQTPYRLHLHQRIAREIPQIRLHSVYTHEISNATWPFEAPQEIGPVLFGKGESCVDQAKPSRAMREWRRAGRIITWMKQNQIRLVVMMGYNDIGRLRMIRWCRRRGIPCFLFGDSNIHGDHPQGIKALVKRAVVGWVVRSCRGILSCGSLGKAYFVKYGADPAKVFYFPYEPDYDLIAALPTDALERARAKWPLPANRRRIIYSGRLVDVKRVDLLMDAFVAIANDRPDWDLVVIGDGPLKQSLSAKVPANLRSRIVWTGFLDDQAMVSAIYRLSDVLVLPSDYEPWALVINEAVASGMAVVCSRVVGAAAELVQNGVNGWTFDPGDVNQLVRALREVTETEVLLKMKESAATVLEDWRRRGDPVEGLRQALRFSGLL